MKGFTCRDTEALFNDERVPRFVNIEIMTRDESSRCSTRAKKLDDLRVPPGDELRPFEEKRRRSAQHQRQRPVSRLLRLGRPAPGDASGVEITDYH